SSLVQYRIGRGRPRPIILASLPFLSMNNRADCVLLGDIHRDVLVMEQATVIRSAPQYIGARLVEGDVHLIDPVSRNRRRHPEWAPRRVGRSTRILPGLHLGWVEGDFPFAAVHVPRQEQAVGLAYGDPRWRAHEAAKLRLGCTIIQR